MSSTNSLSSEDKALIKRLPDDSFQKPVAARHYLRKRQNELTYYRRGVEESISRTKAELEPQIKRLVIIDRVMLALITILGAALMPACYVLPLWAPLGIVLPVTLVLSLMRGRKLQPKIAIKKLQREAMYCGRNMYASSSLKDMNPYGPWLLPAKDKRCMSDVMMQSELGVAHPKSADRIKKCMEIWDLEGVNRAKMNAACQLAQMPNPEEQEFSAITGKVSHVNRALAHATATGNLQGMIECMEMLPQLKSLGGFEYFRNSVFTVLRAQHEEGMELWGEAHSGWREYLEQTTYLDKFTFASGTPEEIKYKLCAIQWISLTKAMVEKIDIWVKAHPSKLADLCDKLITDAEYTNRASQKAAQVRAQWKTLVEGEATTDQMLAFRNNDVEQLMRLCMEDKQRSRWQRLKANWFHKGDFEEYHFHEVPPKLKLEWMSDKLGNQRMPVVMRRIAENHQIFQLKKVDRRMVWTNRVRNYGLHVLAHITVFVLAIIFRENLWVLIGCSAGFVAIQAIDWYVTRRLKAMHEKKQALKLQNFLRDRAVLVDRILGNEPTTEKNRLKLKDVKSAQARLGLDGVEMTWARGIIEGNKALESNPRTIAEQGRKVAKKYCDWARRTQGKKFNESYWARIERKRDYKEDAAGKYGKPLEGRTQEQIEYENLVKKHAVIEGEVRSLEADESEIDYDLCALQNLRTRQRDLKEQIATIQDQEPQARLDASTSVQRALWYAARGDQPRETTEDIEPLLNSLHYCYAKKDPRASKLEMKLRSYPLKELERAYYALESKAADFQELIQQLQEYRQKLGQIALPRVLERDIETTSKRKREIRAAILLKNTQRQEIAQQLEYTGWRGAQEEPPPTPVEAFTRFCQSAPPDSAREEQHQWWNEAIRSGEYSRHVEELERSVLERWYSEEASLSEVERDLEMARKRNHLREALSPVWRQLPRPVREEVLGHDPYPRQKPIPPLREKSDSDAGESSPPQTPKTPDVSVSSQVGALITPLSRRVSQIKYAIQRAESSQRSDEKSTPRFIRRLYSEIAALREEVREVQRQPQRCYPEQVLSESPTLRDLAAKKADLDAYVDRRMEEYERNQEEARENDLRRKLDFSSSPPPYATTNTLQELEDEISVERRDDESTDEQREKDAYIIQIEARLERDAARIQDLERALAERNGHGQEQRDIAEEMRHNTRAVNFMQSQLEEIRENHTLHESMLAIARKEARASSTTASAEKEKIRALLVSPLAKIRKDILEGQARAMEVAEQHAQAYLNKAEQNAAALNSQKEAVRELEGKFTTMLEQETHAKIQDLERALVATSKRGLEQRDITREIHHITRAVNLMQSQLEEIRENHTLQASMLAVARKEAEANHLTASAEKKKVRARLASPLAKIEKKILEGQARAMETAEQHAQAYLTKTEQNAAQLNSQKEAVRELERKFSTLLRQVTIAQSQHHQEQLSRVDDLENTISSLRKDVQRKAEQSGSGNEELREALRLHEKSLQYSRATLAEMKQQKEELAQEEDRLNETLLKQVAKCRSRNGKLRQQLTKTKRELAQQQIDQEQLQKQVRTTEERAHALEEELRQELKKRESQTLTNTEFQQSKQRSESLDQQLRKLQSELTKIRQELGEKEDSLSEGQAEIDRLAKDIAENTSELTQQNVNILELLKEREINRVNILELFEELEINLEVIDSQNAREIEYLRREIELRQQLEKTHEASSDDENNSDEE